MDCVKSAVMTKKADPNTAPKSGKPASDARKDRLKDALKANLRRRKDQARARKAPENNKDEQDG